jgi:hypothetical protein
VFQIKVVEKIKTDISPSRTIPEKNCRLRKNVENYGTDR